MVGWQGDQPSDFNGFCHSLSLILELSNSSQPFVQFRWHTEWIMSVTPESHQNLRPARVIQTSHPQGELRISWRPLKMSGANRPISRDNATDTRYPGQGKTTQTGQTMWAAPWSWILRSNRIIQDPLSSSSDIVYVTIMSVTPVRCIGSGVWTYLFFVRLLCRHLLEADKWQKDVKVGLHQSMPKQQQLWSIHPWNSLEIPRDSSDWWMKFRQNKNWSYSRLCNKWFHHHTLQVCLKLRTSSRKMQLLSLHIPSPHC